MSEEIVVSGVGEHFVTLEIDVVGAGGSLRIAECRLWRISSFERLVKSNEGAVVGAGFLSTCVSKWSRNPSKSIGVKGGAVSIGRGEKSKESMVLVKKRKVKF